jgi:hypothetical protein
MNEALLLAYTAMMAGLASIGVKLIEAVERLPSLPTGIYPSVLKFFTAFVNDGTDDAPVWRQFNSWDGFHLSADKKTVEIIKNEKKDKDKIFDKPTDQIGIFFQVCEGTHAQAHIPMRLNLQGYMSREDYTKDEWEDGGFVEQGGFACLPVNIKVIDPITKAETTIVRYQRVENPKNTEAGQTIAASAMGAIFGDDYKDQPRNQVTLQLLVNTGADLWANIVRGPDKNDPKTIITKFVNRYDASLCTHPVIEEAVAISATGTPLPE